jgi:hypothetical protein
VTHEWLFRTKSRRWLGTVVVGAQVDGVPRRPGVRFAGGEGEPRRGSIGAQQIRPEGGTLSSHRRV